MSRIILSFVFMVLFLTGCFSEEQKQIIKENRVELGDIKINYYSDKSVTSLEIPPDLTSPSYENSFRLSEYSKDIQEDVVNLTNKDLQEKKSKVFSGAADVVVKKSGNRRWVIIDKNPEIVWNLSKEFFKEKGFIIKKSNKKIGIMETDYLENKPIIPASSLGWFRSMISSQIENVNYTLPTVDSYRLRVEPTENENKTEIHLTIRSMSEAVSGSNEKFETKYWQYKERDIALENEMLFELMVYLGSESASAREKLINATEDKKIEISLQNGINGYSKLVFNMNLIETWDNLSWAISNLNNVDLEDRDLKEKAFYIKVARTADLGLLTKIFGDDAVRESYQIQLKHVSPSLTEVFFNDLSEKNEKETKEFSNDFFKTIKDMF